MDRCEHNDKFVKFCITENCQHKEAAGCEYCLKRYHFHLTNQVLLTESDIENAVKALSFPSALRPEATAIQDGFKAYLTGFKQAVGVWVDETIDVVCNRMAYPLLSHHGILDTYRKLKKKDYRKITAKDLRSVTNFAKTSVREDIERDQKKLYIEATAPLLQVTQAVETTLKTFCAQVNLLLDSKAIKLSNQTLEYFIQESSYPKKIDAMVSRVEHNLKVGVETSKKNASQQKESQQKSSSIDRGGLKPVTTTRQRRPSIIVPERMSATKGNLLDMVADQRPSRQTLKEDGDKSNILPPLPIEIPKASYEEGQKEPNKVVTFSITPSEGLDGVRSPIQKEKQRKREMAQQFHIQISVVGPSKEPVLEKIKEDRTEDIVTPGIQPRQPSNKSNPIYKPPKQQPQDQSVMLQHNEKDSLLLFSESLKCNISTEKAIPLLEAALRYAPNNLSAAEYLSFLYLEVGRAKDCLTVCQGILNLVEDKSEQIELSLHLQNNKATALNMLGRYSESIEILEKCIKHRNKDYFYKNLGDAYFCLGIYQKAVPNYERAIAKNRESSDEANYNYAVCLYMQQNYEEALLTVKRALEIEPRNEIYQELEREVGKKVKSRY